jgi:hypothetical protein
MSVEEGRGNEDERRDQECGCIGEAFAGNAF